MIFTSKTIACLLLLIAVAVNVCAAPSFDDDFDNTAKPWQELAVRLPAPPKAKNLIHFYVSPTTTLSFAIDAKSLSVGSDGVVRYVLVVKSRSGATNISYEGIRCTSFESKEYAFGHPDGTWSRARRDKWEPIVDGTANRQHAALAKDYFCDDKIVAGSAQDILHHMLGQQQPDQSIIPK